MSNSKRDKRTHKARNPEKYFDNVDRDTLFKEGIYPNKNYPSIAWSIIGKRRRNSTRKANQKVKQMIHQLERAKNKQTTIKQLKELS
jgi:hypothetical protein